MSSFVAALLAASLVTVGEAQAEDRVILRRPGYSGRITVSGIVEDFTGDEIRIRSSQGETVRRYPSSEVVSIETPQTAAHARALALLGTNQTEVALRTLDEALRLESRGWVRRELLALAVRAALGRGDFPAAGARFLQLLKSDGGTRHFYVIPLMWVAEPLAASSRSAAQGWLDDPADAARLMGASLLFDDRELSATARQALRELSSSADRRVQALAQFQAWRSDVAAGNLGELEVLLRQERLAELPIDLRAGPSYLLGHAYASRHDYELAAATLLWLPVVDSHDARLTARAGIEAGLALAKVGQQSEAQRMYQEVAQRFPGTPAADEARALLAAAAAAADKDDEEGLSPDGNP